MIGKEHQLIILFLFSDDDYSIKVSDDRKEILNEFRKRGLLVNQREKTQRLKKKLEDMLAKNHPIQMFLGESDEFKESRLDNSTVKDLHALLHLAYVSSRSVKRMRKILLDYYFENWAECPLTKLKEHLGKMSGKRSYASVVKERFDLNPKVALVEFDGMKLVNNSNMCYVNSDINGFTNIPSVMKVLETEKEYILVNAMSELKNGNKSVKNAEFIRDIVGVMFPEFNDKGQHCAAELLVCLVSKEMCKPLSTMWKFQNISVSYILRKINFKDP